MTSRLTGVLADPGRLAAVRQTNLLDTPAEVAFDRVARMAARLLEVPIALVPLIEDDRQFFKACVGLPEPWASARQTPLSHSLCQQVVMARQPLAIGDTGQDALARDNPLVRELGLAAYLGVPLIDASGFDLRYLDRERAILTRYGTIGATRGDPMDVITLAIIGFVAIAGPTILALMLYLRDNPDQRPSWRRAREHAPDTDPDHFPGPNWWQPWRSIGGTGSGGGRDNGGGGAS